MFPFLYYSPINTEKVSIQKGITNTKLKERARKYNEVYKGFLLDGVSRPTWSQVFDFIHVNYGLYYQILKGVGWEGIIRNERTGDIEWHEGKFKTVANTRQALLEKLIEIAEKNESKNS